MTQIATTIEQSKRLIELGLNADTADMYYVEYYGNTYLTSMDKEFDKRTDTYAWSLSRLLELMPSATLDSSNDHYFRLRCMEKFTEWHDNAIDTAYEMMCYLLENKLIK